VGFIKKFIGQAYRSTKNHFRWVTKIIGGSPQVFTTSFAQVKFHIFTVFVPTNYGIIISEAVRIIIIDQEGHKLTKILGPKIEKAEHMQVVIPAGTIFGAEIIDTDSFGLFGCLVAPGFEFDDFEMYSKDDLIQAYPRQVDIIEKFGKV
jgi:predicted cupin superfamily sugar epimerase